MFYWKHSKVPLDQVKIKNTELRLIFTIINGVMKFKLNYSEKIQITLLHFLTLESNMVKPIPKYYL